MIRFTNVGFPICGALVCGFALVAARESPTPASTRLRSAQPPFVVDVGDRVQVYFHAHQDGWELFMGDQAYAGLQTSTSVVFVYTTAGDSGDPPSYWQTRESGARAAVDAFIGPGEWECGQQPINGHSIHRCVKGTAVSYDLRLPDCQMSAESYGGRGCIGDLRDGSRSTLAAIDGSATYRSWTDFYTTLRGIVDFESNRQSAPYVEVHAPDYDRTVNANRVDHPDNLATADAVHAASRTRKWNLTWYMDYQTLSQPVNLTQSAHDVKRDAFYAYDNYMGVAGLGRTQYDADFQAWLWRTYSRSQMAQPAPPNAPGNRPAQPRSSTRIDLNETASSTTSHAPASGRTDIYFHAHQDDWQLFMGDRASNSFQLANKVVFVYSTAGDAGENTKYWQTRELAARAAVDAIIGGGAWSCGDQNINGHSIHRCVSGTAVEYDMRLPNCAMNGTGYFGRGCLGDLRDGTRSALVAVDSSATYTSWTDLTATMRGIVAFESNDQRAPQVEVHAPDYNRTVNSDHIDNPDHIATGDAVRAATAGRRWNLNWYVDYNTKNMPINVTQSQHDIKLKAFYAYDNYMGAAGLGRNQYEADYQAWLWRTYYRAGP
ncbi:MAG TPA: hypothetical protein VII30_02085 [Gemmatimonadaceae bacterium]